MVMSVTPTVCITLAFWLGRIGLIASGGCCADTYGAAQVNANRIAKVKKESLFSENMLALLIVEFGALSNAAEVNGKERRRLMSAVFLAGFDRKRQAILPGWQRTGRKF